MANMRCMSYAIQQKHILGGFAVPGNPKSKGSITTEVCTVQESHIEFLFYAKTPPSSSDPFLGVKDPKKLYSLKGDSRNSQ